MTDETAIAADGAPAPKPSGKPPAGYVRVRVLKNGDGKIATGEHLPGTGDLTYAFKDEFDCPRPIGEELEARLFVEIQ